MEQPLGLPLLLSPVLLPSEDALQPADDLLVELDSVHALVPSFECLCFGLAEYSRLEDSLIWRPWAAFLVFADIALAVGLLDLRDDHLCRAEEVAIVGLFGFEAPQVVFEVEAVEAKLSEEFPDHGSVLLLDVGVVVLSVEARSGHGDVLALALHLGHGVVDELRSVVLVFGGDRERKSPFKPLERLHGVVHAPIPRRRDFRPLRRPVGLREGPEEVPPHVPAAMRDRVDLSVARLDVAGHDFLPGLAFDGVEDRPVEAGAPVGLYCEGLHPRQTLERAVQGRCAHCEYRGHVLARLYQRDALLVFAHDARQLGDEVGRAGAADGLPDLPGVRERVVGVCPAPALAFAVADVPGHELDDVFARVA